MLNPLTRLPRQSCFNWKENGKDWGEAFPLCKDGCKQSPIDLPGCVPKISEHLTIKMKNYTDLPRGAFITKGFGWLGGDLQIGEMELTLPDTNVRTFTPLNFHFHSPSDHTFNGKHFDLEMHIVHVDKHTKELGAVLAIMFDMEKGGSEENPFLATLNLPSAVDQDKIVIVD